MTEDVFTALADPTRRRVLDRAGLVAAQRHGREVRYVVQSAPLAETARWMARLAASWDARLEAIRALAEDN